MCVYVLFILCWLARYEVPIPVEFDKQYNPWAASRTAQISYSYAAAVLLAMKHFNERDNSVVPEIGDLDARCTVYFPDPTFADSKSDTAVSTKAFWEAIATNGTDPPCAMLGSLEEDVDVGLRPALAALDIPMLVHYVESDELASGDMDGSISTTLTATGRARAMVEYLQDRQFLANWYPALDQEQALAAELERIGVEFNLRVSLYLEKAAPPAVNQDDFSRRNLLMIKESGVTTLFLSLREPFQLQRLAKLLDELDMLTNEYFFILPPSSVLFEAMIDIFGEQTPGSPIDKLLSGAIVFDRLDLFDVVQEENEDPFISAWRRQGTDLVKRLNALVPLHWLNADPDYFQVVRPWRGSSFI